MFDELSFLIEVGCKLSEDGGDSYCLCRLERSGLSTDEVFPPGCIVGFVLEKEFGWSALLTFARIKASLRARSWAAFDIIGEGGTSFSRNTDAEDLFPGGFRFSSSIENNCRFTSSGFPLVSSS